MVDATSHPIRLALPAALALLLVVVVAGDVTDQIHWPASKLLVKEMKGSSNRRLLCQFRKLMEHVSIS